MLEVWNKIGIMYWAFDVIDKDVNLVHKAILKLNDC